MNFFRLLQTHNLAITHNFKYDFPIHEACKIINQSVLIEKNYSFHHNFSAVEIRVANILGKKTKTRREPLDCEEKLYIYDFLDIFIHVDYQ